MIADRHAHDAVKNELSLVFWRQLQAFFYDITPELVERKLDDIVKNLFDDVAFILVGTT
jgi:hypothetical protein